MTESPPPAATPPPPRPPTPRPPTPPVESPPITPAGTPPIPPVAPAAPVPPPMPPEPTRPPLSGRGWLAVLAAVAVTIAALGGGGYLLNRTLTQGNSTSVTGSPTAEPDGSGGLSGTTGPAGSTDPVAVTPTGVLPTCTTLPPAVDSAGRPHAYEAPNATDGDLTTAWRCMGIQGQSLSISFGCALHLSSVGIDPGYDKTDADGSDRFAQNRKVTKVTWTFDDGSTVEQQIRPERGIATLDVDKTTRAAKMTVTQTIDGQPITNRTGEQFAPFNDVTSVSEVRFLARAGNSGDGCVK